MEKIPFRVGYGYDIHQLQPGYKLFIGGIEFDFEKGLKGHSDADVLLHAITDALLGAVAGRDIGFHFPDTDPEYKGADSKVLLKKTYAFVKSKGYVLGNLDATIIAEAPKMNPRIPEMQQLIAEILDAEPDQVSVKATTHEKLDATGKGDGIAVHCVALVYAANAASS